MLSVYQDIELGVLPVIGRMEARGVLIDLEATQSVIHDLSAPIKQAQETLYGTELGEINLASHPQVDARLKELKCPIKERTGVKGWISLKADVLEKYRDWNPTLIGGLISLSKWEKLLDFPETILKLRGDDGRIHSNFNQAGHPEEAGGDSKAAPDTGRFSSSAPNLQNIPNHTDPYWAKRIRQCFIPSPGLLWVSCDVEQEEPRIIAHITGDPTLRAAIRDGRDIYRPATTALYPHAEVGHLGDIEWKEQFSEERYVGKTFFLAWYYGAGAYRLRELDSRLTASAADKAMAGLEAAHPTRAAFVADTQEQAERLGYVEDLFGRRKWVPEIFHAKPKVRHDGLKKAANHRVQGTGASILKLALAKIQAGIDNLSLRAHPLSIIHDEVNIEVVSGDIDTLTDFVYDAFQRYIGEIELPVTTKVGASWGDAE